MQLCNLCKSITNTISKNKEQAIFLNTGDILDGKILNFNYSKVSSLPGQAKKTIKNNDILFSEIRPKNGRYALVNVNNPDDFVVSTKLMVIRCDDKILPKYLYYYLTSPKIISHLQELAESRSGTFPQITFDEIKSLNIDLLDKNFQQHIVNIIGSIDALIEEIKLINNYLLQLGLNYINLISKRDEVILSNILNEVLILKDGTHNPPERINEGIPLLTGQNIEDGFIRHDNITYISEKDYLKIHSKYAPQEFDLVITKIGTLGKVAIIRKKDLPITIHCNSALLRFKSISSATAFFILNSNDFKNEFNTHKNQTVQEFINLEQIGNLKIKIPNKKYDYIFQCILDKISHNDETINILKNLKQKYLNKFFG